MCFIQNVLEIDHSIPTHDKKLDTNNGSEMIVDKLCACQAII